jgi:hypothetical protein
MEIRSETEFSWESKPASSAIRHKSANEVLSVAHASSSRGVGGIAVLCSSRLNRCNSLRIVVACFI